MLPLKLLRLSRCNQIEILRSSFLFVGKEFYFNSNRDLFKYLHSDRDYRDHNIMISKRLLNELNTDEIEIIKTLNLKYRKLSIEDILTENYELFNYKNHYTEDEWNKLSLLRKFNYYGRQNIILSHDNIKLNNILTLNAHL